MTILGSWDLQTSPGVFMAHCPECETEIDIEEDEIKEGQTVDCPECGTALEVVSTNPLELDKIASEEEEDEEW